MTNVRETVTMRAMTIAALCAGLSTAAGAQEPRRVTLAEALDLAVRGQPQMVQARQNVRVANAQERQTLAAYFPSLSTQMTTSRTGGSRANQFGIPTGVESFYSSRIGLTANWELFTGLRRGAQRSAARSTTDQRDATSLRLEYTTALETKRTFFQALAFAELVNVQQTRLRSADEQLRLTAERLRLGATTRSDSLRAQVERGQALLALIDAQNNLRTAQANLGRALQIEGLAMAAYDSSLEVRVGALDTAALLQSALATAPSVREADAAVAAAEAQTKVSRSAYLPTLSMSVGNSWIAGTFGGWVYQRDPTTNAIIDSSFISRTNMPLSGQYSSGWNLGFTLSFPIFNNLTRETNSVTTNAALQSARATARDARLALAASLTQQVSALEAAAARIDVARTSVQASQEDLRLQRERYRLGAVTIIEVLASQGNLDQAQVDLVRARYDYLVARAEIEALIGRSL